MLDRFTRHAAALAAELERHSESRRRKKPGSVSGNPGGDVEELAGSNSNILSAEERGQVGVCVCVGGGISPEVNMYEQ